MNKFIYFAKKHYFAIIVIFLVIAKNLVWFDLFPIWQVPDEPAHFGYTQRMAEENRLLYPSKDKGLNRELVLSTGIKNSYSDSDYQNKLKDAEETNSKENKSNFQGIGMTATSNPPLYYFLGFIPYKMFSSSDIVTRLFAFRFVSILLQLFTLYFIYKVFSIIFEQDKFYAYIAVILSAVQPMYSMSSVTLNPDNLQILLFSAEFYFIVKCLKSKFVSDRNNFIIALLVGLSFLVKLNAVILLFAYSLMLVFLFLTKAQRFSDLLKKLLKFSLVVFAVSGWWYIIYYKNTIVNKPQDLSLVEYYNAFIFKLREWLLIDSYWARFGWFDFSPDRAKYYPLIIFISFFSIIGMIIELTKKTKDDLRDILFYSVIVFLFMTTFLFYLDYKFIANIHDNFIQGRYFLITLPINTLFLMVGIKNLFPGKYQKLILFYLAVFMIIFNIICAYNYIIPRYYISTIIWPPH